jgi:hypothetical protein
MGMAQLNCIVRGAFHLAAHGCGWHRIGLGYAAYGAVGVNIYKHPGFSRYPPAESYRVAILANVSKLASCLEVWIARNLAGVLSAFYHITSGSSGFRQMRFPRKVGAVSMMSV